MIAAILSAAVGRYAVFAMVGICALAFAIGMVMRHNIRHVEPLLFNRKLPARLHDLNLFLISHWCWPM